MPYPILLSDGVTTLTSVPDRLILGPSSINSSSNCSLNLVGRGAVNYGLATAENFVWLLQNFANGTAPISPLQGQLWYNTTAGALQYYNTSNQWVQVATYDNFFVGNHAYSGYNSFTAPTSFSEIIVTNNNGSAITDILPGTITLKNQVANSAASLKLISSNPSSSNNVVFSYADPNATLSFYGANSVALGTLTFDPTASVTDSSLNHTVFHTGNLSPVIRNAVTQNMTGTLNIVGNCALNVEGLITGKNSGAFLGNLTLNGSSVLTSNSISNLGFLSLSGGNLTGGVTSNSNIFTTGAVGGGALYIRTSGDRDIFFQSADGQTNYGLIGSRNPDHAMAIYAGVGNTGTALLEANGNFTVSGNLIAYSDASLKKDVASIENALALVNQLSGVSYTRIDTGVKNIGFIAQEVQKIVPEVVHENENGLLAVAYGNMLALAINAINELTLRVQELENK